MDPVVHKAFIDRQNDVVANAKDAIIGAALMVVTPRRLLADPIQAAELLRAAIVKAAIPHFRKSKAIGKELADAKK